jgi:hypothetical protein
MPENFCSFLCVHGINLICWYMMTWVFWPVWSKRPEAKHTQHAINASWRYSLALLSAVYRCDVVAELTMFTGTFCVLWWRLGHGHFKLSPHPRRRLSRSRCTYAYQLLEGNVWGYYLFCMPMISFTFLHRHLKDFQPWRMPYACGSRCGCWTAELSMFLHPVFVVVKCRFILFYSPFKVIRSCWSSKSVWSLIHHC